MAQVSPILPHVAITMPVPEADAIATALDMLGAIVGDDMPEAITTFGAQLAAAVQSLNDVLNPANEHTPEDGLAGAA